MDTTAITIMTGAAADLKDIVLGVAPVALGVGILGFGIRYGWGLVKKFSK